MGTPPEDDGGGAAAPSIRRFTTHYDIAEDRVSLTLERAEGEVLRLWLTRRLLVRMVPELVRVLEKRLVTREGRPARAGETDQRRDQRSALGGMQPQDPVRAEPGRDTPDHLITGVGLRLTRRAILLDMKSGETLVQAVPFAIPHIRQWLAVLNQCFRRAGWDEDIWPAWLEPLPPGEAPPGLRLN